MTYHGKTFTSKVTLREVFQAISRFGVYAPLLFNKMLWPAERRECDSRSLRPVCISCCCRVRSDHLTGRMKRTANVPLLPPPPPPMSLCLVFSSSPTNVLFVPTNVLSAPPRQLAAQHRIQGVRFDPRRSFLLFKVFFHKSLVSRSF